MIFFSISRGIDHIEAKLKGKVDRILFGLEVKENKNNCNASNFCTVLKFPALFSVGNRREKGRELSIYSRNCSQGS